MMDLTGSFASVPGSFPPRLPDRASSRSDEARATYFGQSLLEPPYLRPTARIHCFVPADRPDPGKAADILLLDGPADSPARVSTTLIALAFGRDGSIWGKAGAESARASAPADWIAALDPAIDTSTRPIARLVAAQSVGSDTIDMIFSGGDLMIAA